MAILEGGQIIAKALKRENVEYLFTLCGGTIESIYEGCLNEGIKIIDTRVDQSATMMADAYARVTGGVGVSAVTRGPGHANMIYGLATSHMIGSPQFALSGNSDADQLDMGGSQEYNQIGMVKPITKWARLVHQTGRLPEYIETGFRKALGGRPGPVHLSVPYDILYDKIDDAELAYPAPSAYRTEAGIYGDPACIYAALKLLSKAKNPVIIAGGLLHWQNAADALLDFVETTGIPFFTKDGDVNAITRPHPLFFGTATSRFASAAAELRNADVVLTLGVRFDKTISYGKPPLFDEAAKFIVVDIDPEELGKNRSFEVGIVGDMRSVLAEMTNGVSKHNIHKPTDWIERLNLARQAFDARVAEAENSDGVPIHPLRICKAVRELFGDDATIALDGGDTALFTHIAFNHYHPPHFLFTGPIGGIGQGVPFALAGKLARPEHPAILISGDGAFGYGIIEYDTALKHNLPLISVISSDQAWGIVRHPQIQRYGLDRAVATDLRSVSYERLAQALDCYGERVTKPSEIRPALQRAADAGVPAVVNVETIFTSAAGFCPQ
jgi:acetolactate synthase I/II/III large subunit